VKKEGLDLTLHAVLDPRFIRGRSLARVVRALVKGGVTIIQMREKDIETREFLARALLVREVTRKARVPFLVNDRVDIAIASRADGVHLGQRDLPAREARRLLGPRAVIGVSTHNLREALKAESDGADYAAIGSVFATTTKSDVTVVGLDMIRRVRSRLHIPLVAIGGITPENARSVIAAGAEGVAAISGLLGSGRVVEAARRYRQAMDMAPNS
jgi:thiamine-phosphate pyrophosphorylase